MLAENRYNTAGRRTSVINGLLKEFKFTYDANGHLLESEDPYGNKRVSTYSPAGKLILSEDEEHVKIRREYDSFGRLAKIIDGAGNEISYEYLGSDCSSCGSGSDLIGRIIYPTFTREMEYDNRARVVLQRDILSGAEERITRMTYDDHGNLETVTDPLGRVTTYGYDALGRKISRTNALGEVTRFVYDKRDNLVRLEDPANGFTYFEYDLSNRLVKETKPLQQETVYSYDDNGNLASIIDADGRKIVHTYDPFNRRTKTEYFASATAADPAKTISYTYNKLGRLTGYDDSVTSATYTYDDLQRRTSETINYGPFSLTQGYTYYGNSRKKSYTDPSGRTRTWSYDQAGRPTGLDLGDAGEVSANSFVWNRPTRITLPGGSTLNYSYDGLQEPTAITAKDPGENPVIDYGYTYSSAGRVTAKNTEHGNYAYGYDQADRLLSADGPADDDEAYTYDPLGNRLTSTDHNNWVYDDNNRLQSFAETTFAYDAYGNMTGKTVAGVSASFIYSVDNRLQRVEDNSGSTVGSYYYDPFGRRLWKEVGGTRTYFLYNDEGLAGEYDASGTELRTYGYHAGSAWSANPLFVQQGGQYYWYLNDHLGAPQKIIAENGAIVWSARYDAFGHATVDVATVVNNLRFPGQYFDTETGLHYNFHRYYDPETGRYVSADPIGLRGGINLYAYVLNDPVNFVDPTGLDRYSDTVTVITSGADIITSYGSPPTSPAGAAAFTVGILADKSNSIVALSDDGTGKDITSVALSAIGTGAAVVGGSVMATTLSSFGLGTTIGSIINGLPVYGDDRNISEWWLDKIWDYYHPCDN